MARKARKKEQSRTPGLTPAQTQAAALIGTGHTMKQVCEALDIGRTALYHWMITSEFQALAASYNAEVQAAARERARSLGLRAVEAQSDALEATKPIYLKDDKGFAPVEDVPDHGARLKAADAILDRIGMPRRVETEAVDQYQKDQDEIARRISETA